MQSSQDTDGQEMTQTGVQVVWDTPARFSVGRDLQSLIQYNA